MKKIELLAPAGSMESLKAAVQAGADAVYLGGSKFSARAYATNFDEENMKIAIEYCHFYGVKIYVTINTLLKETEISSALEYANFLYNIGVDAVIIQDLGLAYLIKRYISNLEIHASTQITVHNLEGCLFLRDKGFKRIVLSRELSLNEIEHISKNNIETEIFIHGALCISYSGQCLMSSIIGGRSGNRGRCAQPCRLPYRLINKRNNLEKEGYIMSPKDICTLENIEDIINSGASSLKIEGRMKRPEYVAGVVSAYRKAIDNYYNKSNLNLDKEKHMLSQLFNREGFSKAYLYKNEGKDMMAYNFPKNTGLYLGKVEKDNTIILKEDLSVKDGIRVEDGGFIISKILKDNLEVNNAKKGDRVKLYPQKYKKNEVLYKTSDNILLQELSSYYENIYRKYDLNLEVSFKVRSPLIIKCNFMDKVFEVKGEVVEEALKKPLEKEKIINNLTKTGNTAFEIKTIEFIDFENGFIKISEINEVRRNLIESLNSFIKKVDFIKNTLNIEEIYEDISSNYHVKNNIPNLLVSVTTTEQLKAVMESNIRDIAINIFNKKNSLEIKEIKDFNIYLKVPNIIKDEEWVYVCEKIQENISSIKGILTANLGIINKFKYKVQIIGDYKINFFNSYAYKFLNDLDGIYVSTELNKKELKDILRKMSKENNVGVMIYGRYELMVSEYCPIGSFYGAKTSNHSCIGSCIQGDFYLKDRMGEEFLVNTDKFCRSYIYNSFITNLIDNSEEFLNMNIKNFRIDLLDENYEESREILNYMLNKKGKLPLLNYTKGHYKRGVE